MDTGAATFPAPPAPLPLQSGASNEPEPPDTVSGTAAPAGSLPEPDVQASIALMAALADPNYLGFVHSLAYLPEEDCERIKAAYAFAAVAHAPQKRQSGEAYITHPLSVASTVVEWRMDTDAIIAALLHDVLEDTPVSKLEINERFGKTVADLVDGLSKLDKMEFNSAQEAQAENFRKMLIAMARDLRVILIKLADRQHNLNTMSAMRPDKRKRIARETLDVYAPIASRLGLNKLLRDMQTLCLHLLHPHRAAVLEKALKRARGNQRQVFTTIQDAIVAKLAQAKIGADVFGREKTLYSIYCKMRDKHLSFSQVLDIYGFRVVVGSEPECYLVLGVLHSLYKPVPGKFKDHIAVPKANGYQSLHTTLVGPYGLPIEVQIRTQAMHHVAQEGVAAHWLYKEAAQSSAALQQSTRHWLQSLLDMQHGDSHEFYENVKTDLFPEEVYVFSPKGKIYSLPHGATLVDFAYAVHTDIGNCCIAARVNHESAPLRTELNNGDLVEIVTAPHSNPNPAWLGFVKTGRARSKIRHYLKTMQNEEASSLGERLLTQELFILGIAPADVPALSWERLLNSLGSHSIREVYVDIAHGKRLAPVIARSLATGRQQVNVPVPDSGGALIIRGTEGMAVTLAHCCRPIPGDPIVGVLGKGHGLMVHRHDCEYLREQRHKQKWVDVEWDPAPDKLFEVSINIEVKNTPGVLARVAATISQCNSNIESVGTVGDPDRLYTTLQFCLRISDRSHLAQLMRRLRNLTEVLRINRTQHHGKEARA